MALIDIQNLTFSYPGSHETVFENLNLRIDTHWKLALTGRNGRGKTTLLRLLMGKYPHGGKIIAPARFSYFPYAVQNPESPVRTVFEEIAPEIADWEIEREFSLLKLDDQLMKRSFSHLSNGEKTKVLLAALFLAENNFILIDEPTNHLDIFGRETVSRYLRGKDGFILVSHDRAFLDRCVDHVLSLNRTDITLTRGNFSTWLAEKEKRDQSEIAENAKHKKEIVRLSAAAKRATDWADRVEADKHATKNSGLRPDRGYIGHKSAKMMQRAKNTEMRMHSAAEKRGTLCKNVENADRLKLSQPIHHAGILAAFDNVSIFYGERAVCSGLNFSVARGDRIALTGKNGSGKTSVLKCLRGELIAHSGNVRTASGLLMAYVAQDTSGLAGNLSAYAQSCAIDETLFKAILRKLGFSREQFEKGMENFSAGQKKKVLIARSLCEKAHLLLWDEPLNYVDVLSRMQIENLLLEYRPTILFVEHDRAFCENIATKEISLDHSPPKMA